MCCLAAGFSEKLPTTCRILILQSWDEKTTFEAGIRHLEIPSDIIGGGRGLGRWQFSSWLMFLQLVTRPLRPPGLRGCKRRLHNIQKGHAGKHLKCSFIFPLQFVLLGFGYASAGFSLGRYLLTWDTNWTNVETFPFSLKLP